VQFAFAGVVLGGFEYGVEAAQSKYFP